MESFFQGPPIYEACRNGDEKKCQKLIYDLFYSAINSPTEEERDDLMSRLTDQCNEGLVAACEAGNRSLVEVVKSGADDWDNGLSASCRSGNRFLVDLMIEKGANDWNNGLFGACYGGDISLVNLMIEKGATNWNDGLEGACDGGHRFLVDLMIEKGANDWNIGLSGACRGGKMNMVKFMIDKGADDYTDLDIPEFVQSISEKELIPFSRHTHLLPKLKDALTNRVQQYHQQTRELIQELVSLSVIIPDIVNHILVPYIRYL
jgi:hypothetical protein